MTHDEPTRTRLRDEAAVFAADAAAPTCQHCGLPLTCSSERAELIHGLQQMYAETLTRAEQAEATIAANGIHWRDREIEHLRGQAHDADGRSWKSRAEEAEAALAAREPPMPTASSAVEQALAELREINQSMRGIPCPACAEKDQQMEAELQTLRAYRDRICTYETTIDGLPENPHTKQGLTTFAPTFCPSCGGRVVVKQWWKPEGM